MTDPWTWSPISLGRWGGVRVRLHFFLLLFLVTSLLFAALADGRPVGRTAGWLFVLLIVLAWHELGHALAALWIGCEPDEVRLWPLGNMLTASTPTRSAEQALVAAGGPLASFLGLFVSVIALRFGGANFPGNPFGGNQDAGGTLLMDGTVPLPSSPLWWLGWFCYLNEVVLLANLIPALPFDLGRLLRALLSGSGHGGSRDSMLPLWTAHSSAAVLALGGIARLLVSGTGDGVVLIGLAVLIELIVRAEALWLGDGGYFDDGVFGYDFSEGYTSLESSAAAVQPRRESALRRWRRRRSDQRRRLRAKLDAAEDRRMDAILEKIHREGRDSLTREENRFLIRVSSKYRNRPKTP